MKRLFRGWRERSPENTALDLCYSDMKCRRLGGVVVAVVIAACAMTFYLFSGVLVGR